MNASSSRWSPPSPVLATLVLVWATCAAPLAVASEEPGADPVETPAAPAGPDEDTAPPGTASVPEQPFAVESASARAEADWDPGFQLALELGGASVLRYSAPDETGNAFGGLVVARVDAFTFGLGLAAVMPDSRTQASFLILWAEARFDLAQLPLGSGVALSPHVLMGIGGALADGFLPPRTGFIPPRWSRDGSLLAVGGLGARLGAAHGMYLNAEVRAYNHTHLGLQLLVGHTFW